MDEDRIIRVEQQQDDGLLTIQFQFQLEGMGKPDKFKISAVGFTALEDTVQEMKEKLCKVAKKLQKRLRRKQRRQEGVAPGNDGAEGVAPGNDGEDHHLKEPVIESQPSNLGILSSIASRIMETLHLTTPTHTAPQPETDVTPETLGLIEIQLQDESGAILAHNLETKHAFRGGCTVLIKICDEAYTYEVYYNLPTVRILELPRHISSGFLLYPRVVVDFCDPEECQFDWFRIKSRPSRHNKLSVVNGRVCSGRNNIQTRDKVLNIDTGRIQMSQGVNMNTNMNEAQSNEAANCDTIKTDCGKTDINCDKNTTICDNAMETVEGVPHSEQMKCTALDLNTKSESTPTHDMHATLGLISDIAQHSKPVLYASDITLCLRSDVKETEQTEANGSENQSNTAQITQTKNAKSGQADWEWIVDSLEYTPSANDIGCYIGVVCTPKSRDRIGCPVVVESKNVVWKRPDDIPFEKRHEYTMNGAVQNSFRILTYNILAEKYSDTCESRDFRYNYCPAFALTYDYRKQLVMAEILGYKPDIMCLQEVDCKAFDNDLLPVLSRRGYDGYMATKYTQVSQGVATFFCTDKFYVIDVGSINTAKALESEPAHSALLTKLSQNPSFLAKALNYGSVLHTTILQQKGTSNKLIVANTHLKCGKEHAHIRLVQIMVCTQYIQTLVEKHPSARVVFCGDLNSLEYSGVVDFFRHGQVTSKHADWFIGGRHDYISGMDLQLPLETKFNSAYTNVPYTNYVSGFYGTLDYIHYDATYMKCVKTVPLPSHCDVTELSALPNQKFPSDHMALVCDLQWVEEN